MARLRSGLLLALFLLIWPASLPAATVTLLRPKSSPAFTEALYRLQGELLSVGLEVILADGELKFSRDAVIRIVGDSVPVGADIWIFQESSGDFRLSRVLLEPGTANAPQTLAIRAIEVLRANFLVLDPPPQAPPPQTQAAPRPDARPAALVHDEPPPAPAATSKRFGLAAGAAVLSSLEGVGPAIQPLLRLDGALSREFALEATLSGFGTRPTVATDAGSVRVAQDYGVLALRYAGPADSALGAFVALGAGALRTRLDGSAESPLEGHELEQWAFLAEASLGAIFGTSERTTLRLAGHLQLAAPYVAIHFVDEQVAAAARPNLLVSLSWGAWL